MQGVPHSVQPHGPKVWCCPLQVGDFLSSIPSSSVESWSLWHWWVGDMSIPQLWQVSTLPWSLMGDTRREDCVDDFLNFSVEEASLWDFPLWIFKPFSVLKLDSQWSHWKASSCVTVFWLDSKPVEEAASYWDFFIKNSCLRLAFLLRADGLFLLLADMVFLPSLVSKEKVKVGPMVRENRKSLPWLVEVHAFGGQGGFLFTWGSNHSWELLLNYEKTEDQLIRHVVSSEIKMTFRGTMVRSEVCNSLCFCLES